MNAFEKKAGKRQRINTHSRFSKLQKTNENHYDKSSLLNELSTDYRKTSFQDQRLSIKNALPQASLHVQEWAKTFTKNRHQKAAPDQTTLLTHGGKTLQVEDDTNLDHYIENSDSDYEDLNNESLSASTHFGQGLAASKSRKEIYAEIIEKSKIHRSERQRANNERALELEDLDMTHKALVGTLMKEDASLSANKKNEEKEENNFTTLLSSLRFDSLVKASSSTKTPEDIMHERAMRLRQLEAERQEIKDLNSLKKKKKLNEKCSPLESDSSTRVDQSDSQISENEDMSSEGLNSDSDSENDPIHDSESDTEINILPSQSIHESPQIQHELFQDQIQPENSDQGEGLLKWAVNDPKTEADLPYYIELPNDQQSFDELMQHLCPSSQWKIIWRMRTAYASHASKDQEKVLLGYLYRYIKKMIEVDLSEYCTGSLRTMKSLIVASQLKEHLGGLFDANPDCIPNLLLYDIISQLYTITPRSRQSIIITDFLKVNGFSESTLDHLNHGKRSTADARKSKLATLPQSQLIKIITTIYISCLILSKSSELLYCIISILEYLTCEVFRLDDKQRLPHSFILHYIIIYNILISRFQFYYPLYIPLICFTMKSILSKLSSENESGVIQCHMPRIRYLITLLQTEVLRQQSLHEQSIQDAQCLIILETLNRSKHLLENYIPDIDTIIQFFIKIQSKTISYKSRYSEKCMGVKMLTPKYIDTHDPQSVRSFYIVTNNSTTNKLKKEHTRLRKDAVRQIKKQAMIIDSVAQQKQMKKDTAQSLEKAKVRKIMEIEQQEYHKSKTSVTIKSYKKGKKRPMPKK